VAFRCAPDTEELHRRFAVTRDRAQRDELAVIYDGFAVSLARRFPSRREQFEDLAQVARLGLLKALERFEPDRGQSFMGFAGATISGELKRHIRDKTWSMRIPRSLQEHYLSVVRAADDLAHELRRSPTIAELAERCALSEEQVLEAMELGVNQRPASLDAPTGSGHLLDPGTGDVGFAAIENRELALVLMASLSERDRRMLELRFREGLTQREIAVRMGISQMQVSRLLARVLERLRLISESPGRGVGDAGALAPVCAGGR
jgi:RNA polymerase sigma-B factor